MLEEFAIHRWIQHLRREAARREDALEHFAGAIAPRLDPALLAEHPLLVVGNGADARVADAVARVPHARLVGWVPSVVPYLHAARISVLPLRFGGASESDLGEERRLFYVGMTRARERLFLTRARERARHGKRVASAVSPFVREIVARLLERAAVDRPAPKKGDRQLKLF